jgi:hypothetical protein
LLAVCLVLLSACAATPQDLILGKWEVQNAPTKMTAEFNRDGTAAVTIFGQTVHGTYKLSADGDLEWSMNGHSTTAKVKVTATELELTDSSNRTIKYRRV